MEETAFGRPLLRLRAGTFPRPASRPRPPTRGFQSGGPTQIQLSISGQEAVVARGWSFLAPTPVWQPAYAGLGGREEEAERSWGGRPVSKGVRGHFHFPAAVQLCGSEERTGERVARPRCLDLCALRLHPRQSPLLALPRVGGRVGAAWPGGGSGRDACWGEVLVPQGRARVGPHSQTWASGATLF